MSGLARKIIEKNIGAAAELIRKIEEESPDALDDLSYLYPHTGNASILGITGLPGSGKSTIINLLIKHFRNEGKSVGVVAVDPSSPISDGAILGDRIRMVEHSKDREVFIKSLATRGWYGGLSRSTARIINVLDAMGKDVILLETVGVGQTEVSIMNFAHTTVLVLVPEMGDYVQTIKAGVLEIGDIFIINKIDKKNPGELLLNLQMLLQYQGPAERASNGAAHGADSADNAGQDTGVQNWRQKIILTDAIAGRGFDILLEAISSHRQYFLKSKKDSYLKRRAEQELRDEIYSYFIDLIKNKFKVSDYFEKAVDEIFRKKSDPYSAAVNLIEKVM